MATATDLVFLDEEELTTRLDDSRRELFNLRFQLATGQLDNPARLGLVKRDVARILTVLRDREISEAEGTYVAPSAADHEAALAKLEAADAAQAEKDAARVAAAEHDHDHDHDHDDVDEVDDELDDDAIDDVDEDEDVEEEA